MIQNNIKVFCIEVASILGLDEKELTSHLETNLFGPPYFQSAEEMLYLYIALTKKYSVKMTSIRKESTFFTTVKEMNSSIF